MSVSIKLKDYSDILNLGVKLTLTDGTLIWKDREHHNFFMEEKTGGIKEIKKTDIFEKITNLNYWQDANGEMWELNELDTHHLENIKNLISDNPNNYLSIINTMLRNRCINEYLIDENDIGIDID